MLKLCGFAVSNYYNKVKIALLEKGVPFEEEYVALRAGVARLADSPARKIPFIDTGAGVLSESQVILDYLEDAYPQVPLLPAAPLERARVRELVAVIELYLELPARRLYKEAFFGGTISPETKDEAKKELERGAAALATLGRFAPFVAGAQLTQADCAASVHLPLVAIASKKILGEDALAGIEPLKPYLKMLGERPAFKRTHDDRKAAEAAMVAARKRPTD
jgi:glutathione S-transferase